MASSQQSQQQLLLSSAKNDLRLYKLNKEIRERMENELSRLRMQYDSVNSIKAVDNFFFNIINNPNVGNTPIGIKFDMSSRLYQGNAPYQYIGNKIELSRLYIQLFTNIYVPVVGQPQLQKNTERSARVILLFLKDFNGSKQAPPDFSDLFSGPDVSGSIFSTYFSQLNPSFWRDTIVIYDSIQPLGCFTTNPVIVRTPGNFFFGAPIDLCGLETTFQSNPNNSLPQDNLYQNVTTGLLMLYVVPLFFNNPDPDFMNLSVAYRLEYKDET